MALLDIYKKLYPIGNKVAFYRDGMAKPDLGVIVDYVESINIYGNSRLFIRVRDWEYPEKDYILGRGDRFKVYYTDEAVDRDQKNRLFC